MSILRAKSFLMDETKPNVNKIVYSISQAFNNAMHKYAWSVKLINTIMNKTKIQTVTMVVVCSSRH